MTILDFTVIGRDLSGATFDKLTVSLEKLLVKTELLDKQKVNIRVDVDDAGAVSKLTLTSDVAEKLDKKNVNVRVGVADAGAVSKLEATSKLADSLERKRVEVRIGANNAGAIAKLAETEAAIKGVDASAARSGSASGGMSLFGRAFTTFGAAAGISGSAKLAEVRGAISETDSAAVKATGSGGGIGKLGVGFVALGVAAAIASGIAVHLALSFDETVHKMAASADIPVEAAKKIGDAFLTTGGQTTFSAQQMADAFGPVAAKLGELQGHALDSKQALEFMRAAMDATEATSGDLSATTDALSKVMVAFGIGTAGAANAADILTNASHLTNVPIANLADGMDKLHAKLGTAAPDLAGMSTLLVDLGNHGITGTKGLNQVNSATTQLLGGSKAAKAEIAQLGLKVTDSAGHFVGFGSIIEQLQPKLAKMNDEQKRQAEAALFGSGAQGTMNAIIAEGKGKYDDLAGSVTKAGSAEEGAAKATDTLQGHWEKIKSALADTGIAIGKALLPALEKIVGVVQPIIQHVTEWLSAHPKLTAVLLISAIAVGVLAVALVAIAAVVGAVVSIFSSGLVVAIVAVIAGLVAAAIAVWAFHKQIFAALTAVWKFFVQIFGNIKNFFAPVIDAFKTVGSAIGDAFSNIGAAITRPFAAAIGFIQNNIVAPFMNWWNSHWPELKDVFIAVFDAMKIYLQALWTVFKVILDVVIGVFRIAFDIIKGIVSGAIDVIVAIVKVGFAIVSLVFKAVWDAVVLVFKIAWSIISNVVQIGIGVIVAIIKTTWAVIVAVFKVVFDIVVGIFSVFLDLITGHWSKAWQDVKNVGIQVWNAIKDGLSAFLNILITLFSTIGEHLKNIAMDIWHAVAQFFQNLWHDIVQFVTSIWHDMQNLWIQIRNAVVNTVLTLWHDVVNIFVGLWHDLVNNVTALWHDIEAIWHHIFDALTGWAVRTWHDVVNFFQNLWHDIVGTVIGIWNSVTDWFGRIWRSITDFAGRIWHDVVWVFEQMKNNAIEKLSIMRDWIVQIFKDIANRGFFDPINWVIRVVINGGIGGIVREVGHFLGQNWDLHVNELPRMAKGGVIPGYAPGQDTVPVMLSPGEGILVPEAVRKLGGESGIASINAGASSRVGGATKKKTPGTNGEQFMSFGGIISDIWSSIKGAATGVINWARERLADTTQFTLDHLIYPIVDKVPDDSIMGKTAKGLTHKVGQGIVSFLRVKDDQAASERIAAEQRGAGPVANLAIPNGSSIVNIVKTVAGLFGWNTGGQWDALTQILGHESGWNPNAQNPSSTAYGLFQFLNSTWGQTGIGKTSDPELQTQAGLRYIQNRYGSPVGAWDFWQANHWFKDGGLVNSPTIAGIGEAGPELILPLSNAPRTAQLLNGAGLGAPTGDAEATARYRHLLEVMNAKKFATGGVVGKIAAPVQGATQKEVVSGSLKTGLVPSLQLAELHTGTKLPKANTDLIASNLLLRKDEELTGVTFTKQWQVNKLTVDGSIDGQTKAIDKLQLNQLFLRNDQLATQIHAGAQWDGTRVHVEQSVLGQNRALDSLRNSLGVTRQSFTETAGWAGVQFNRAYAAAANPIRDVINRPIRALVDAWNSLDGQFAFGKHVTAPVAPFAAGGLVTGPGGPTEDKIPARLSNGEFIVKASVTRRITGFLQALNAGQPEAVQAAVGRRFADGGLVQFAGGGGAGGGAGGGGRGSGHGGGHGAHAAVAHAVHAATKATHAITKPAKKAHALVKPKHAAIAKHATGGFVSGISSDIPARLSSGEFVVQSKVAEKITPFLFALNSAQPQAIRAAGNGRAFADGGIVADTGSAVNAMILKAQLWAKAQSGKPYIWGGVGPAGYDCSGYQSAITNVLRNQNPYHRLWSTSSWARGAIDGFTPGLTSGYAIGVSQGNPGHMAGTLGGVNVESGGPHNNVAFGGPAVGADSGQFPAKFSLPFVGGRFVPGGGGGIDIGAIVNQAFGKVPPLLDDVIHGYAGNIAAAHSVGMGRDAERRLRDLALAKLGTISGGGGDVQAIVRSVMTKYGWGAGPEWDAVDFIVSHESGWNPNAANPSSSARGLFQKLTSVNGPLEPTIAGQAEWGANYMRSRYRDPLGARAFWQAHHWYANGGLVDRPTRAILGEAGKELVLPLSRPRRTSQLLDQAGLSNSNAKPKQQNVEMKFKGNVDTVLATAIMRLIRDNVIQIKQSQIVSG